MNIWFTSDLHFSHKNIAGAKVSQWNSGFRTFDSIDQMNDTLFNTLNKFLIFTEGILLSRRKVFSLLRNQQIIIYSANIYTNT